MRFFKKKTGQPNTKSSRFAWLRKLRPRLPKYFRESFAELKKVTWPSRRESWKLTFAVFAFSIIFALIVVVADFGIELLVKRLFL